MSYHPSPEIKERIRIGNIGKHSNVSPETKAKLAAVHLGKKSTPEVRARESMSRRGPLGSGWKGGVTPGHVLIRTSAEYAAWRTMAFERDGFTCQACGNHGDAAVHHMDCFADFPEKRLDVDNGITFCVDCHKQFHLKYGTLHNRKWQTDEFVLEALSKSTSGDVQPRPIDELLSMLDESKVT